MCDSMFNSVDYLVNTNSRRDYEINKFTESTLSTVRQSQSHVDYKVNNTTFIASRIAA